MSEGDVSLISDEDVLRRMWQQTEDFGRKKEIRSHMYRLREERLRNLYSPEPALEGKDLKELSNAGWNVESENRTTDDGHTRIRAVQANIEGRYDVEGGKGQFAAIDQNKQSVTEYHDDNTSLKRNENSSHAAAHEQVMRHTDDGSHFSSTTSSSTSTSKFQQTSSTKHETVPYATNNKYDISQPTSEINDNVEELKRTKTTGYEQNLRKSDHDQAELVSRKVEYPDDNTKIIIETRCLPDGTRVTSTRREFRAPAINTNYSEHQSQKIRKENKSFTTSSQKRSDVRQTSRITDEFIDNQIHDIVDSQRIIDDKDFNKVYHTDEKIQTTDTNKIVHNQDSRNSHHVERHTYNTVESNDDYDVLKNPISDDNASDITYTIINDNDTIRKQSANYSKVRKDEYKQTMKKTTDTRTSNIDQHNITSTTDCARHVPNVPQNKDNRADVNKTNDTKTYKITKDIEDNNYKISTDKKVEEIINKKTTSDQHQTTYQTDFTQNKISTEWSPTHQAWASTLRADTPPNTRPSTRASSPGSRTFKSSTSSLRSSVSPDKTVKKPGSRGTSPIKTTRTSPSRTTSETNSSTHLTNTVTKEVTNRYTSPERKHPHGSSPTRYSVSPDRKHRVDFRPKSNISPEKHHDRKTSPTNDLPSTPIRYNQSPEKLGYKQPTPDNPTILSNAKNSVRPSASPERKPPTGLIRKSPEKKPQPTKISTPTLPGSVEPEVRPYRKPDNEEITKPPSEKKPTDRETPKDFKASDSSNTYSTRPNTDRKSTNKHDSTIVVNKTSESKTITETKEDDYELVGQKISTHYHNVEENKDFKKRIPTSDDIDILKSSIIQTPTKNSSHSSSPPGARPTLRTTSRSPSPPKGPVTFTSTEEFDVKCSDEVDRTEEVHSTITNISLTDDSKDNRNRFHSPKDNEITHTISKNKTPDRETSPSKYTTYDKKQQRTEEIRDSIRTVISDSRDDKFTREKSPRPFSKSPESPKKFSRDRDGVSPAKSSSKYSHTSDFINTERKTEEINKKTKDRPRQLVTPSTSPTRKPAGTENAPSTGQSSPTTSVSGFVYFSSPNTEKNVTNYDQNLYPENEINEYTTKNIRETPSKLPCKPPIPKQGSPSKDALPRKSSLKKPTESIITLPSPTEKPPTTFLVSPTEPNVLEHKIAKKDQPTDKVASESPKPKSQIKQKPPLERRETYEERCRKILGMMDSSNKNIQTDVQKHSPSISPCRSPGLKDDLSFTDFSSKTIKKDIKSNITDFIKHEQTEIMKTTKQENNVKPLSRDTSPTKLKDILVPQNEYTVNSTFTTDTDANLKETVRSHNNLKKLNRSSLSPERKLRNPSLTKEIVEEPKHSRTPSPTKNTRYVNEKPKSFVTKVIDHCTDEKEIVSKNSIEQISKEIHRETPSLQTDEPIYSYSPQTSSVVDVIKNISEKSKQTYYDISKKSSETIHKTIHKSDEPHSRTPSPSKKNNETTEYIIRDKDTRSIPHVQPKQSKPIESRTPSPSKTVLKTPENHENAPKYLSEKPYDRRVKEKPKESIHSRTPSPTKNVTKTTDYSTEEKDEYKSRREIKRSDVLEKITPMNKSQRPERSRTPSPTKTMTKVIEYTTDVNEDEITRNVSNHPSEVAQNNYPKQKNNEPIHSRTPSTNKSVVKDTDEYTTRHAQIEPSKIPGKESLKSKANEPIHSRTPSPTKSFSVTKRATEEIDCLTSSIHQEIFETTNDNISTTILKEPVRSRTPSPTKPMTKEIKNSTPKKPSDVPSLGKFSPKQKIKETNTNNSPLSTKTKQQTHSHGIPTQRGDMTTKLSYAQKPVKPKDSDNITPEARKTKFTKESETFIVTEREQEVSDQPQKFSKSSHPERRHKSPTPAQNDTFNVEYSMTEESLENISNYNLQNLTDKKKFKEEKPRDQSIPSKLPSRNTSPTKKTNVANPTRPEKTPESPTQSRSLSPRKPMSPIGRPQSPQIPKTSVSKSREPVGVNKLITLAKNEKTSVMPEIKKTTNITKQNSFTRTSTNKNVSKFISSPPNKPSETTSKSNVSKKESEIKITRTTNDIHKKPSSQKTRSKPEIQVTEVTSKYTKTTPKPKKPTLKEPQTKLIGKPKSATALNTSTDDEDVLIDVQQAKSSRENSPDRICPTPVNILDDSGTPRFPDEVKEPDDDFRRRTHHTIHETETIVDDIVEISEEDELFVKKSKRVDELDENSLGVNNKVKPKDGTKHITTTKNRIQTDFFDENSKSDECLLSVSEKVNKFAKGPKDTKDSKSPSRRVVDEYNTNTVYQDNYTKLSVNDKANLFIQTAEKIKSPITKAPQKAERPDLNDVDDSLKSDDCLLSVSDKVNKFVKTAEQFFTETNETEEKEKKIKEKHEIIMKSIVQESDNENYDSDIYDSEIQRPEHQNEKPVKLNDGNLKTVKKETVFTPKKNELSTSSAKPSDRTSTVKITTLRSSEAVKKAKALFENIASTTNKPKDHTTTKLTDIGVNKKTPRTISTIVHHPSVEESATDGESDVDISQSPTPKEYATGTLTKQYNPDNDKLDNKLRSSPSQSTSYNSEVPRSGTPSKHTVETFDTTKTVISRYPVTSKSETQKHSNIDTDKPDKPHDYLPGYLKPTKTSQIREETKTFEENSVSSRRGSGKFGIELRRTSTDRTSVSSEGRHSVDLHQPCIEDIFDVDLLEQMLEKVTGYEQRRRIRAQIRIAKKQSESSLVDTNTYTKTVRHTTPKNKSPERQAKPSPQRILSPDHAPNSKLSKAMSPERRQPKETSKLMSNGHLKEPIKKVTDKQSRLHSPEKNFSKLKTRSPVRHPSPEKKPSSISSTTSKSKTGRFNEYATAYMKKVGINESDKSRFTDKTKKVIEIEDHETSQNFKEFKTTKTESTTITKTLNERISSKDTFDEVNVTGNRSSSPSPKRRSPERQPQSPTERLYQRSPSPEFKRPKAESVKKETTIKTVHNIEKKTQPKLAQEDKPSWVTNRNLKKLTSETRNFSSKKVENEKPKYRAPSPSKVISKPTDVITSSYGPGPLDADGRPLFGIKALRHGATNYQVKGTVIRQEYHSKNGGEPEGTVSVTAYSTEPEDLEKLMAVQGERPSRLHGLAAITTTKKFGGSTGTTIKEVHSKQERASLEQFTHSDRKVADVDSRVGDETEHKQAESARLLESEKPTKVSDRRQKGVTHRVEDVTQKMEERKQKKGQPVRQSSVKSLTEKFIKNATESTRAERSSYPKAGLILRTTTTRESISSDSSNHAGLCRTDSEHSLASADDETVVTTVEEGDGRRVTTTTTTRHHQHQHQHHGHGHIPESFLDSSTKVTGVQDILTRMKNADIVITEGDSSEDAEARALLNKFLGASVLMAGMQAHVERAPPAHPAATTETVRSSGGRVSSERAVQEFELDQCWDERVLRKLLEVCTDYEQRRRLRARIRTLMAEQEACATAVTDAVSGAEETSEPTAADETREEEVTVTSSVRRNSSEKTVSSSTTTKTSKVIESVSRPAAATKPVSPFAKFRQLEKQNSTNTPNSPASPGTPGSPQSPGSPAPYFKFTDPALQASAVTIKERLLQWCRDKTRDYENVKLENFSTSWADGLAFCALVHHFLPTAFDYSALTPDRRRHNFTLAFKVADEKAGIYPLLDVDDMVAMRKPDWKCVFTYVQSIHRRFKDQN